MGEEVKVDVKEADYAADVKGRRKNEEKADEEKDWGGEKMAEWGKMRN